MHKHLQRHAGLAPDLHDLFNRQFPRHHHPLHPEFLRQGDRLGAGERHLGRRVERKVGAGCPDQPRCADILNQHSIDPGSGQPHRHLLQPAELVAEHQRVERGIALQPPAMEQGQETRHVCQRKIGGSGPGIEALIEAKIDRIGPIFDRCLHAFPIPRRGEEFGGGGRPVGCHAAEYRGGKRARAGSGQISGKNWPQTVWSSRPQKFGSPTPNACGHPSERV